MACMKEGNRPGSLQVGYRGDCYIDSGSRARQVQKRGAAALFLSPAPATLLRGSDFCLLNRNPCLSQLPHFKEQRYMDQQEQRVKVREALRNASQDDAAASSGCLIGTRIEHLDITCDGCDEEPITGSRWALSWQQIVLCSATSNSHARRHTPAAGSSAWPARTPTSAGGACAPWWLHA